MTQGEGQTVALRQEYDPLVSRDGNIVHVSSQHERLGPLAR